jgi:hypothetical protein
MNSALKSTNSNQIFMNKISDKNHENKFQSKFFDESYALHHNLPQKRGPAAPAAFITM